MDEMYAQALQAFSLDRIDVPMIAVGLVLFFILYKSLEGKVFVPYIDHLEQRELATAGALETASLLRQKAAALQERYDQKIFEARVEANTQRLEKISVAKDEAALIVAKAETEVAELVSAGRKEIEVQIADCRSRSEQESVALAELLSNKVDSELSVH